MLAKAPKAEFAPPMFRRELIALLPLLVAGPGTAGGAESPTAAESFRREVIPVLRRHCLACHDERKAKGGYRLDTLEHLFRPGDSGEPPVVPGDPTRGELLRLVTTADPDDRMPYDADPLTPGQVDSLRRWIRNGAKTDGLKHDVPLGELLGERTYPDPPARYRHPVAISALAFSPDGSQIAVGGYHEVLICDLPAGELLRRIPQAPRRVDALLWLPGQILAAGGTAGESGNLVVLDPATGRGIRQLGPFADTLMAAAATPAGDRVAVAGADRIIRCYDAKNWRQLHAWNQHADWVTALRFNATGTHLASASRDRTAKIRELKGNQVIRTYSAHYGDVRGVEFPQSGKLGYSVGADRRLHEFGFKNEGSSLPKAKTVERFSDQPLQLVRTDDRLWVALADGSLHVLRRDGKEEKVVLPPDPAGIATLAVSPDERLIAAGHHDGGVTLVDTAAAKRRGRFEPLPR